MKQECEEFVASDQAAETLQPTDRSLHNEPMTIAAQCTAILRVLRDSSATVGADELDPAASKSPAKGVTISGTVVEEPLRVATSNPLVQQWLNQCDFGGTGGMDIDSQRQASAIHQYHELGTFAAFGV